MNIYRAILSITAALAVCAVPHAASARTFLIDFGTSNTFRGVSVENPDSNGNNWNAYAPGDFLDDMIDTEGNASHFDLGFSTPVGTDSYNGPAGETSDPPTSNEIANTEFDAAALDDLGATNAVFDYFSASTGTTVRFSLINLDPTKTYDLSFFCSHKYPVGEIAGSDDSRTTIISATDSNGVVNVSTGVVVGVFDAHNSNTVVTLAGIKPDLQNKIFVAFNGLTSSNRGYVNCMKIDVVDPPALPPSDEAVLVDFGNDLSNNGADVDNPDGNGNNWNSVWSAQFYSNLVNTAGEETTVDLGWWGATGTDNFNGPAGEVDAAALGSLGGDTNAVNDYYVNASIALVGLDPNRTYSLTFFGSHKFATDPATVYEVHTDSAFTNMIASVSLNVRIPGVGGLHNSNTVVSITGLVPQEGNKLYVRFAGNQGNNGYLNAMRIDAYNVPVSYDDWATNYPGLGGRFDDDDGDGLDNLAEFGSGGNPTNGADLGFVPYLDLDQSGGSNSITYTYARLRAESDLTYTVEISTSLVHAAWQQTGSSVTGESILSDDLVEVANRIDDVHDAAAVRLRISETPAP